MKSANSSIVVTLGFAGYSFSPYLLDHAPFRPPSQFDCRDCAFHNENHKIMSSYKSEFFLRLICTAARVVFIAARITYILVIFLLAELKEEIKRKENDLLRLERRKARLRQKIKALKTATRLLAD